MSLRNQFFCLDCVESNGLSVVQDFGFDLEGEFDENINTAVSNFVLCATTTDRHFTFSSFWFPLKHYKY